jgi:hypothetical protein
MLFHVASLEIEIITYILKQITFFILVFIFCMKGAIMEHI